jgi:hypothetical protein
LKFQHQASTGDSSYHKTEKKLFKQPSSLLRRCKGW